MNEMAELNSHSHLHADVPETKDLDQVLEQMDPDFAKNLESIKNVQAATDVHIESVQIDPDDSEATDEKKQTTFKTWVNQKKLAFKNWRARTWARFLLFIKTVPKEVGVAVLIGARNGLKTALEYFLWIAKNFFALSRLQKFTLVLVAGMSVALIMVVQANLKGRWIPMLNDPILTSFEPRADSVTTFDENEKMISFSRAFPQDPEIFLFDKIKVNLKRGTDHPNPMGAFEFYTQVDSHETAVELQSRQVELHDGIQRVLEGLQYDELVSDLGKNRLKGLLKTEINHALTQGWVVDIHFKTFILKP